MFGIIRLGYVAKSFYGKHSKPVVSLINRYSTEYFHPNMTFTNNVNTGLGFWTTAQVSIGVVAACLPLLGPLIRRAPTPKEPLRSIRASPSEDSSVLETLDGSEQTV